MSQPDKLPVNKSDIIQTVPLVDYIDKNREVDFLKFHNGVLRKEIEEICATDKAKIRAELMDIKSAVYDLYKRLEGILNNANG